MSDPVIDFRDACLRMEASGNHGKYGISPGDVDMRRGIWFWGSGRGFQLKKNWREVFAKKWPDVELPPKPEPKPRPKRISRAQLEALWEELKACEEEAGSLSYFPGGNSPGWYAELFREVERIDPKTGEKWTDWKRREAFLGRSGDEAAESIRLMIASRKQDAKQE